ncbi:MAG TPA: hypothetical protein VL242_46250 [Sorangium sp.]|nr:hypothetical protein [Sorangium sp.]
MDEQLRRGARQRAEERARRLAPGSEPARHSLLKRQRSSRKTLQNPVADGHGGVGAQVLDRGAAHVVLGIVLRAIQQHIVERQVARLDEPREVLASGGAHQGIRIERGERRDGRLLLPAGQHDHEMLPHSGAGLPPCPRRDVAQELLSFA